MYRTHIARRVLVVLTEGTIDGTLVAADKEGLQVERCTHRADSGAERVMDGLVCIPHPAIQFVQVV